MDTTRTFDIQILWEDIVRSIKETISENNFNTWLSGVYPLKVDESGRTLVLGVPNELTRSWIQKHYQNIIVSELMRINPSLRTVKLTISRRTTTRRMPKPSSDAIKNLPLDLTAFDRNTNLSSDLVFDEFIVAPYNRFAYTASQAIIEKLGVLYNPFYVYGPTGVGKTHLLQAIGNRVKSLNPSMSVYYTTTESFMENFITAVKKDRVREFRNTYQGYQLFIIDDVHFLQKSEATLVEMFHLFNILINKNAQIVLSSDQPPSDLDKMQDRIRTRLNSGVVIDIEKPGYEDMRVICVEKVKKMNLNLTPDSIEYIVEHVSPNVREISGALKNIHLHTATGPSNKMVDLFDVKKYVKNHIRTKTNISYEKVIDIVCDFYDIKPNLLSTKLRKKEVVHARQITMYIFREHLGLSYSFIGKQFGNRDHTTVMHACEKINSSLQDGSKTQKDFDMLLKKIEV